MEGEDVSNMADMSKAEKLAAARKKLKEFQQKTKDSHPAGIKTSGKSFVSKSHHEKEEKTLEQNSVFDSGPAVSEYNKVESEPSSDVTLQQSVKSPSNGTQESLNATAAPEKNHGPLYHSMDLTITSSGNEVKKLDISHNGDFQEMEKNGFREYSEIFSTKSVNVSEPFATLPSRIFESEQAGNTHSSDIVAARDFFDSFSNHKQNQETNNADITSCLKGTNQSKATVEVFPTKIMPEFSDEHLNVENESQINITSSLELNSEASASIQNSQSSVTTPSSWPSAAVQSFQPSGPIQNSELSATISNSDTVVSQETINIAQSYSEGRYINSKTEDIGVHQQDIIPNAGVTLSTPDLASSGRSSSESLRQLSLQISGLIEESAQDKLTLGEDGNSELERRNQELAAMLATEQQKKEQLELQLKEYQSGLCQLQLELDQLRTESEARVTRELGPVQEQLQLHVQTVGILVGEKTELQAALTKSQNLAKQKAGEVEELQGRLKASRHKVTDLEKDIFILRETNERFEKTANELTSELDKMKLEQKVTTKRLTETEEEISELHQKLNTKTNDYMTLQQELQEKLSQLALTQLRVQQLSTTDTSEVDGQLETLHQQNVSLEKQVAELQQTLKSVGSERNQASQQYQQYVQHLNTQIHSLASKLDVLSSENEQLELREQKLIRHISELEKQLQQQQNQKRRDSPPRPVQEDLHILQEFEEKLATVESEKHGLVEKLETQLQENQNIQVELEERSRRIEELESMLERLEGDQPNKDKLLAAMESDKVAAARAVGQNQQLKQQLEELQEGFVKMSNNKLELTEKLEHEKHICKEQGERLAQQEEELKDLRAQLSEKDQQLQQNSSELSNQMLQQSQITDRMRHYEAHGQLSELLQQELEQAKERIQALSTQNSELRTLLAQQTTHDSGSSSGAGSLDDTISRKDEMLATLSASVRQLELERDQLLAQLQLHEHTNKEQNLLLQQNPPESESITSHKSIDETSKNYESMKVAMEQLEERFSRTMKEVAELSDEKQRLEHLVLQLQGETETIGEYIALYQVQRSILRQRAQEKDEQLLKLAKDREEMRNKLGELNELVRQLVAEKDAIRKISHSMPVEHGIEQVPVHHTPHIEEGIPNGEIVEIEVGREVHGDTQTTPLKGSGLPSLQADTAGKIMALLSEIGTSSLVDPQCNENFHPCPWCSGRLITV